MVKNIAINGFGRIGKSFLRAIFTHGDAYKELSVGVINIGSGDINLVGHLFKYDTLMGPFHLPIHQKKNILEINGFPITLIAEENPLHIKWASYKVDWVVDCSGKAVERDYAEMHLASGAQAVLISAPAHNEDIAIIPGVNDTAFDQKKHKIVSLGSCTTNALFPMLKVIQDSYDIMYAHVSTTHAYTNSQVLLDIEVDDARMSRAAALNIIPSSTGATKMIKKIMPELEGRITLTSLRVPVAKVSLIQLTFSTTKTVTASDIIETFENASRSRLKNIVSVTHELLVSSDFSGSSSSVVIDAAMTTSNSQLHTLFGWYDNEWGYSCRLRDFLKMV